MGSKSEEWISEASNIEKIYELCHRRTSMLLAYQLSLSSLQPLQEYQVKTALIHLHRKCPALRVCFGQRDGQTWLRYMTKEVIDFQVMKDAAPDDVRNLLQTYQYNSEEGPLWCARLLNSEADSLALDEDLPYTSHLFFGVHHTIADGFTMMKICGGFVRILNDVIDNKPICDKEQLGYFVSEIQSEKLIADKLSAIQQNPSLMQEVISRAEDKGLGIPLLLKVEPPPEGEDKSHTLTHVLDKDTTKRFIEKCKAENVSINSGFTALLNASMVSFLVEKKYIKDSYKMYHDHTLNSCRYWPADCSDAMGCHVRSPLRLSINVPRDLNNKFWDFARSLHQEIHHHLKEEPVLLLEAYKKLISSKELDYDKIYYPSNPMQVDCGLSNLTDVTHFFENSGPYVKPYLLARQCSLHCTNMKHLYYFFQTFRGRLIVSLVYNSKFIRKAVAQKNLSQIFSMMKDVINSSFY